MIEDTWDDPTADDYPRSDPAEPWWKTLADNWRGRNGNSTTGDSVRNSCADELEKVANRQAIGVAQAEPAPVAWRLTDGEGDYEYLTEEPLDQSRAWSRRYGREWEPLYASPVSSTMQLCPDWRTCKCKDRCAHSSTHKSGAA